MTIANKTEELSGRNSEPTNWGSRATGQYIVVVVTLRPRSTNAPKPNKVNIKPPPVKHPFLAIAGNLVCPNMPAWIANHKARFGSSCPITELAPN